ncbi:WG repeat-containing protein [Polaribacter ponticola]|uniref:WG repeat-containing protein n=1 Tax=Polaribacter ponticola TaxID=2978475 RepID=A0ABT5S7L0_9FLAO|nr:WG repeat-containing protein [Polaribacter sp. MSW5]MDD7914098.1 WG repeat-containing protein [Polaribacter sp. MSW5]
MKVNQSVQYITSTDYGMQGNNIYITKEQSGSGIKNTKGEFLFEPFYNIESFHGYFILNPNLNSKKDDFIIINKNGKIIYKEKNTSKKQVFPINDEIFAIRYQKNNNSYVANNYGYSEIKNIKTGKVTERVFSSVLPEVNGLIKAYRYNEKEGAGKWGFLDENFKTAIGFIYTNKPGDLYDNRILVKSKDRKYGFIDKRGRLIIEAKFLEAKHFVNGYAMVKLHKKKYSKESKKYNYGYRVIDVNGRIIRDLEDAVPATFHSLKSINAIENEGVVRIKINQKKGFL